MPSSVYIHIPFCKSKCKYCSFVSFVNTEKQNDYVNALLGEIDFYYKNECLKTLYFGGGTPSLLSVENIKKIIEKFNLSKDCEVTIEVNPDDICESFLESVLKLGVNRLSIGSQSFDNRILQYIGRRHDSNAIIKSVQTAKKAGFKNISLDLIYGLPFQTEDVLRNDLAKIIDLNIPHISTYGLKIEKNSYFYKNKPQNLPDDDLQADFYELINETLESKGFYRYEVSNFSQKGFESKHNLNYWNNEEYYGFGISAHGYVDGVRYSDFDNFEDYFAKPNVHKNEHKLTLEEKLQEEIFLGFRKSDGIDTELIKSKYFVDFEKEYKYVLQKYSEFFEKTTNGYKLTTKGTMLSNIILSEFV